ncbi:SMP-30/gluconolactonase/LRE family protein [Rhodohalobacter halophilus]|uniref:hypothetical protein n=1 Tax=Rhodohalobacter halophilus TaxID=1812810 RepID=UPI00083FC691|nr:hypothetical protein [Rhodohalobacter halophilus]
MKLYVFILFLLQLLTTHSDSSEYYSGATFDLSNISYSQGLFTAIHPENGDIYMYNSHDGRLFQISDNGSIDTLATIRIENGSRQRIDVHPDGDKLLFWDSGVGRVHAMNLETKEVTRLDESHDHRNQFGHGATLGDDGNIYAMGGYGYWQFKNNLIYYSQPDKQWELFSSPDPEVVPINNAGRLFRDGNSFYYLIKPLRSNSGHSYAYQYNPEENLWVPHKRLTQMLSQKLLDVERPTSVFSQTSTNAIDRKRKLIGLLQHTRAETHFAYLLSYEDDMMYEIDLSQLGIYDAKNLFYVHGKDHWVILGHPFSTNRRNQLIVRTFQFDESHPALSSIPLQFTNGPSSIFLLGSVGGLFLLISGWLFYRNVFTSKEPSPAETATVSSNTTIELIRKAEDEIDVYFNGKKFSFSGDPYLTNMFDVLYEMKSDGTSEMLISKLDQKIFSDSIHSSYKSRMRKKVIQIINSEAMHDVIQEKKSQTDKRVKIVKVDLDRIKITPQDS